MDVILIKEVEDLGNAGEMVSVARGYARNFLIPQGMAVTANDTYQRILAEEARLSGLRNNKLRTLAEAKAGKFSDVSCTISVQASEDEKLYGSVGDREIATALQQQGHEVDHRMVRLDEPIKQLGVYTVPISLHEDVEVAVKVWVVRVDT